MKHATIFLLLIALFGCQGSPTSSGAGSAAPPDTAGAPTGTPTTTAAAVPSASAARLAGPDVPTEEDYEDEAEREITDDNLESELDKLEKEIGD